MNKPEKKYHYHKPEESYTAYETELDESYNQACDDYEEFLPSEEEIEEIIFDMLEEATETNQSPITILAKALSKRIRGET